MSVWYNKLIVKFLFAELNKKEQGAFNLALFVFKSVKKSFPV